ncbi:MetQ/NlpA family ABC transporter substrate-binding protein [Aerococcus sp. UMB1112A]|uniref:MetQ/NlpA family ABC transporter substrate-binding protein n=1 Tax=Aerococcus sp. UMB1112A TaxID=3050609 RepID=UPI00254C7E3F|nr:MetQ/NlpA family ABC transporter substrate-binding protein [Aerococcus sp. UMB1112A]MDK8501681.1 MetQ/NlpA family ABC transporter substrate-binding protein [Aerococcus sp. UMB1112A]
MLKVKKWLGLALGLVLVSGLLACSRQVEPTTTIRVATSPGPYSELFLEEVKPALEKEGYQVENRDFDDLQRANIAIQEGSMDLNVDQHTLYMEQFNREAGADLVAVTPVPTVPTALFAGQKKSLDEVAPGDQVAISDDPVDVTRSLLLLEKAGWIRLDPETDKSEVGEDDIIENKAGIELSLVQAPVLPQALKDVAYAIIPGSTFYDSGMSADQALLNEDLRPELKLQAVVRSTDQEADWVKDLVKIYQSDQLKERVEEINQTNDRVQWAWTSD